ncbi:E3 ubiquitin-protein ligase RNF25 isoform X2 [Rhinatrema bivittatum]|uniref:E3 ubiquitin-protein ligase RNF25 isoform X2 n=1 Tax=Rhinatrema bivittatum TaxID=194408 RepID=UPI00112A940D|nr:E3 ubiquitin-protein ligase RNF25 isoform X2 [Rhinatrema bivittatum]
MEAENKTLRSLPLEVEVLESIYLDELRVSKGSSRLEPWEVSITLYPATADDQETQYVRFCLMLSVPPQYPQEAPTISIQNPRGLSDEQLHFISQKLKIVAETGLGSPIMYDLIEKGKELLTDNNIPHGQCVICLYGFQENETFTKTSCYHYFHSHCLASYAQHMEEELQRQQKEMGEQHRVPGPQKGFGVHCPVCRELLTYDLATLQAAPAPQHPLEEYCPDAQAKQHQQELLKIYKRQQAKGGIIDPEEEKNRYFISLQTPPVDESCLDVPSETVEDAALTLPLVDPPTHMVRPFRRESNLPETAPIAADPRNPWDRARGGRSEFRGHPCSPRMPRVTSQGSRISASVYPRESREYSRKPEKWEQRGQLYKPKFSTTHARNRAPILLEKGDADTSAEWNVEAQDISKENFTTERKGSGSWQNQCQNWDCGRWGRSKLREQESYPRTPRRGGSLIAHGQGQRDSWRPENKSP